MDADSPDVQRYVLLDGRVLCVTTELGRWSAWIAEQPTSHVIGYPLEGVIADVIGLNPAHDEIPNDLLKLAERIRQDIPHDVQYHDGTA